MIQRSVLVAAAAAALVLAPGTAMAQSGQDPHPVPQSRQDTSARQSDQGDRGGHGHRHHHHHHHHHHHYEADDFQVTESDPTPDVHRQEVVFLHGAQANERVTLTITSARSKDEGDIEIAGTKSLVRTANSKGVATFTVTLAAAGVYPLTMTNASGEVLGTNTLTAVAASPATPAQAVPAAAELSAVGFAGVGLPVGGAGLVLAGAGAVLVTRRRRSKAASA